MDILAILFLTLFLSSLILSMKINYNLEKALTSIVILLILTISSWASASLKGSTYIFSVFFIAFAYGFFVVLFSYLIGLVLGGYKDNSKLVNSKPNLSFILAIAIGWVVGYFLPEHLPFKEAIFYELLILAVFAGLATGRYFSTYLLKKNIRTLILSITSAFIGGFIAGYVLALVFNMDIKTSMAISLGMGWYTYAGPLIASYEGVLIGNIAFLANFIREQLTFILVPFLRGNPHSLLCIGGATTMDDTLPIYIAKLGKEYSILAISNGFLLTLLVPIVLPLILI